MRKIIKAAHIMVVVLLMSMMLHASDKHHRGKETKPTAGYSSKYDGMMPNIMLFSE